MSPPKNPWIAYVSFLVSAVAFLSYTFFNGALSTAKEFEDHKVMSERIVGELKGADAVLRQRMDGVDKKLDSINDNVNLLVRTIIKK